MADGDSPGMGRDAERIRDGRASPPGWPLSLVGGSGADPGALTRMCDMDPIEDSLPGCFCADPEGDLLPSKGHIKCDPFSALFCTVPSTLSSEIAPVLAQISCRLL